MDIYGTERSKTLFSALNSFSNHRRPEFTRCKPLTPRQRNWFEHTHVWDMTVSSRVSPAQPVQGSTTERFQVLCMKSYGRKQELNASRFSCRMTQTTDVHKRHVIISNILGACAFHLNRQNRWGGVAAPSGNQKQPKGRCLGLLSDGRERWWWTEV